jgi:hypothetical protein
MRAYVTKKGAQHAATFAKGGARMFAKQAAGPDKPGNTGKDQSPALGAKFARGGAKKRAFTPSRPAKAGSTRAR